MTYGIEPPGLTPRPNSYGRSGLRELTQMPRGSLKLLYSGKVGEGVWSNDIIKGMVAAGEDVRVINEKRGCHGSWNRKTSSAR